MHGNPQGLATGASDQLRPSIDNHPNHPYNNSSQRLSGNSIQTQSTNIIRINDASSAQARNVHQQPPSQTFHMYRGSQLTFSGGSFRTVQGAQILEVQGRTLPVEDEDQHTADARYEETFNEFVSDDFTTKQDDYTSSSVMNSEDVDKARQLSFISDHIKNGNNDFIAFVQHNTRQAAAPSNLPASDVRVENGNDGQSIAGADVMDESIEEVGKFQVDVSVAKKRRRSNGDDGDSSEGIDNSGDGLPKAQLSTSQRKPVKRAKSNTPVESIEDPTTMQSASAQPAARTHVSKFLAVERLSRRQSLAAADFTNVKVADGELTGMSFIEAQEKFTRRMSLQIDGSDDVAEVKAEPKKWIVAIMKAFDEPYSQTPNMPTFKQALIPEFQRWQKEHYAATMEHLEDNKGKDLVEACATMLYHLVVDAHEKGAIVESAGKSFTHDVTSTCKQRLERIIQVLTALAIVRRDLVTGFRLNELVASPSFVMKRKEENKQENDKKKEHKKARTEAKAKLEKKAKGDDKQDDQRESNTSTSEIVEDHEMVDEEAKADDSVSARNKSHSSLESMPADDEMSESEEQKSDKAENRSSD